MVKGESDKENGLGLVESCFGSWRGVTVNVFSSVGMAEELFAKK